VRAWGAAVAAILLSSCSNDLQITGRSFDPVLFFTGHSRGEARLHVITGGSHAISIDSHGRPDGRGGIVLDQSIAEEGKAARVRRWVLHPAGANRWTGTLTDASGPVAVERGANDVTIRYRMRNSAKVEQHLQQMPNGTVANGLNVTRFGIRVAWLEEQITKLAR
jgi:hypothetical protein